MLRLCPKGSPSLTKFSSTPRLKTRDGRLYPLPPKKIEKVKWVLRYMRKQNREAGLRNSNFIQDYTYSEELPAAKTVSLILILLLEFPVMLFVVALFSVPASLLFLLFSPLSGQTIQSCVFFSLFMTSTVLYLSFAASPKKNIRASFLKRIAKGKYFSKQDGVAERMIRSRNLGYPSIAIGFNSLNAARGKATSAIFALSVVAFLSFTVALEAWVTPSNETSFLQLTAPIAILFDSLFGGVFEVIGLSHLKKMGEQPTLFKVTVFTVAAVFGFLFSRYYRVVSSVRLRELSQDHLEIIFEDAPDDVRQYLLEVY